MSFIKFEATNEGSIGMLGKIYFYDIDGNQVNIEINKIQSNMNARTSDSTFNGLLGKNSEPPPYYEKTTGKAYYIFEVPDEVYTFKTEGWSNKTYGHAYNVSYSEDNIEYVSVIDNCDNGASNITMQDLGDYMSKSYFLVKNIDGIYSMKNNALTKLVVSTVTKELFMTEGVNEIKNINFNSLKLPFEIIHYSDKNKIVKANIIRRSSMYNSVTKRYEGMGAIYIPLKDLPENAKKCRIHLKGYNYFCKTALSKTPGQSSTLFTSDNAQYGGGILEIDMKAPPMTTTHKHTKDNPLMLCVSTGGDDGYLEAVSYSWI